MAGTAAKRVLGDGALLLEREGELATFERALDRASAGEGSMLLIEGPAGIGKTRLLAEFARLARKRDVLVLTTRGGPLEREMSFGLARLLLEPVIERSSDADRARLLAGSAEFALMALGREDPAQANPERDPLAAIHGLYWLMANLAESRPVVLVVDDAHWSDRQTLRWLDYLTRRLTDIAVFVVVSVRSGEPDEPAELASLRLEAEILRPAPLSQEATEELIAAELAQPTPEFTAACVEATAGNPFLIDEVLRTLRADAVEPTGDAARSILALGPESIARYVLMRLGRFGAEAVSLARAIAVLGVAPQLRQAAQLAGLDERQARELCDRLREAEILAPGPAVEFVHPLVRSSIYDEQSPGERSASHRKAAEVLAESGAGPDQVASHLLVCPPNGDQWVVGQLLAAAGDAIRSGGFDSATAYLERALEEPPDDELPFRLALGMSMIQTDLAHAPEMLARVADEASNPATRAAAARYTAIATGFNGDWKGAVAWFDRAIEALPAEDRDGRLAAEGQRYCVAAASAGRSGAISRRLREAAKGAVGDTQGECLVRQALAFDRFLDCDPIDELIDLAASTPPPPWELSRITPTAGMGPKVLAWGGAWAEARRAIRPLIEWTREQGLLNAVCYANVLLSEADRLSGELADAEAEARTALEIAGDLEVRSDFMLQAVVALVAALLARGDVEAAEQAAQGSDFSAGVSDEMITPWPLELRGYMRLQQGALEEGVNDLQQIGDELLRRGDANPALSPWAQEIAPALAALDRTAEAGEIIQGAEQRARRFRAAHAIGTVLRSRGLIEPRKRQIETLRESVQMLEQYGPPHELATSLLELGAAMRRDGQRSDSREPLRRALELAHKSGAGGTEQRARDELAAAGSRPRSVMRTGVSSLTASELRTAKLAAEGLQNTEIAQRLFVSKKTVEKHLGNVYMKLEIEGRKQLAGALASEDVPP